MKIKFLRQYRKKGSGNLVFVYTVQGTKEQLAAYKKSKGENHRVDETTKAALFFSSRFIGTESSLIKTSEGQFVADTTRQDQILNLISQGYTAEMAEAAVAGSKPAGTKVAAATTAEEVDED
jgi:hypothetical protein